MARASGPGELRADRPWDEEPYPGAHIASQRIRNNVMDWLETAACFDEQRQYQADVPFVHTPTELLVDLGEQIGFFGDPSRGEVFFDSLPYPFFTAEEAAALKACYPALEAAFDCLERNHASHEELFLDPDWIRMREAAGVDFRVFEKRGQLPTDREI